MLRPFNKVKGNEKKIKKNPIAIVKKEPEKIKVADKPLNAGGVVYTITKDEYKKKFDCEYTEGVYASFAWKQPIKQFDFCYLNDFVICYYNNEIGYCLYTEKCIPINADIMLFSGQLSLELATKDNYCCTCDKKYLSPKELGGRARFMPHFSELGRFNFYDIKMNKSEIVCDPNVIIVEEDGLLLVRTIKNIPKNSILGFDYGEKYWGGARGFPRLFTYQGTLIDENQYYWRKMHMIFNNSEYEITRQFIFAELKGRDSICSFNLERLKLGNQHEAISWFDLRQRLVDVKFIPSHFGKINACNDLITEIKTKYNGSDLTVAAFYHHPPIQAKELKPNEKIDIVCRTNNERNYDKLMVFFSVI